MPISSSDQNFGFRFAVAEHGWAIIELHPAGKATGYRWHVSYLSDALGDFIRAASDICTGHHTSASATWQLEPAVVRCELERLTGEQISCEVSVADDETSPARGLVSFTVPRDEFVAGILAAAATVDRAAYAERWPNYRFPDDELTELASSV